MSLIEDSLDETRVIKSKKSFNKQETKMLKKKCLEDKLAVIIKPIDHLLDFSKVRNTVIGYPYSVFFSAK